MIAYSYIQRNLRELDIRYKNATSIKDASYFSKMAILELCGWIEVSMDDVILRACSRLLTEPKNKATLHEKVSRNYGFEYQRHFSEMLISLIGLVGFEKLEKRIDSTILQNFRSELGALKSRRNGLAHTYTRGVTTHYDAPSITISRYQKISMGLRVYDQILRERF